MASQDASARTDAQRNRAALLDAAADVLAVAPNASLAEVATRAGLGRATLYRHFPSRELLLAALRDEALSRARTALDALDLEGCDTREGLGRVARALVPLGMRFRILVTESAELDADFLAARDATLAPLRQLIVRGMRTGELLPQAHAAWPGVVVAALLMSAVRAATAGLVEPDAAGDLVVDTFLHGFGAR